MAKTKKENKINIFCYFDSDAVLQVFINYIASDYYCVFKYT